VWRRIQASAKVSTTEHTGYARGESDVVTNEMAQAHSKVMAIGRPETVKGLLEGLENLGFKWVSKSVSAVEMAERGASMARHRRRGDPDLVMEWR
jgi:hypothetical protein